MFSNGSLLTMSLKMSTIFLGIFTNFQRSFRDDKCGRWKKNIKPCWSPRAKRNSALVLDSTKLCNGRLFIRATVDGSGWPSGFELVTDTQSIGFSNSRKKCIVIVTALSLSFRQGKNASSLSLHCHCYFSKEKMHCYCH